METKLEKIISIGEIITTEFKESKSTLPEKLFETVCAFLNTKGNYIFLGVNDNREIELKYQSYIKVSISKLMKYTCNYLLLIMKELYWKRFEIENIKIIAQKSSCKLFNKYTR